MFDLEKALAAWRRSLTFNRAFQPEDVDELERHLRDQVKDLVASGFSEEDAFRKARQEFGQYGDVEREYRKVRWESLSARGRTKQELGTRWTMFVSYIRLALRSFRRNPLYFGLNLGGLTVGMAAALLIMLFIRHETSYDTFFPAHEKTYRVVSTDFTTATSALLAPSLKADFPEIESVTRVSNRWFDVRVTRDDFVAMEKRFFFADSSFFRVLEYPLVTGDPDQVLAAPFSVVITQEMAAKYFGDADPMGQRMNIKGLWDAHDFTVTGIAEDMQGNSHFQWDFLASYSTRYQAGESAERLETWYSIGDQTYVRLHDAAGIGPIRDGMENFARLHFPDRLGRVEPERVHLLYTFQPLSSIHLESDLDNEWMPKGDPRTQRIFLWVAVVILVVAFLNYINMSTSHSLKRAREVGVRKVVGAARAQLMTQFQVETLLIMVGSAVLATAITRLALPWFGALSGRMLLPAEMSGAWVWWVVGALVLLGVMLAGSYPAILLSAAKPAHTIKGLVSQGASNGWKRKALVFGQFALTAMLLFATGVLTDQLEFLQSQRLGMNSEQVLVINNDRALTSSTDDTFKDRLRDHTSILSVGAVSDEFPIRADMTSQLLEKRPDGPPTEGIKPNMVYHISVDDGFLGTLDIALVEGRDFDPSETLFSRDRDYLPTIVNRKTVEVLGWDDPIGKEFECCFNPTPRVVGVMEDFHFQSATEEVKPLAISTSWFSRRILVRVEPNSVEAALDHIETVWKDMAPEWPLEWAFMDDQFAAAYTAEQRLANSFRLFSGLAVLIACLGLFGLATITVQSRIREIGIRKVMGARAEQVVRLVMMDLLKPIAMALVVGLPVAGWLAYRWLQDYPYRIELGPAPFFQIAFLTLMVAFATISLHTWRAARINPADAIRHE